MAKNLGFGFMRLPLLNKDDPTSFDYELLYKLVDAFMERGFTYFDTALSTTGGFPKKRSASRLLNVIPAAASRLPPSCRPGC
jgi:predicted aldo/keto reductase-like oxidoreductase